jgi:hypothetical protein
VLRPRWFKALFWNGVATFERSAPLETARRRTRCGLALAVCIAAGGCLGPNAVHQTRLRYNEVYRDTTDQQILLNLVRLRYADSPVFIDMPNITSQFELGGRGNYLGGIGNQTPGPADLGFGELTLRDTPTLSYHPRAGQEVAKTLLTPLTAELIRVINAGANLEQFMLMAINDLNDVPNANRATLLLPLAADDNNAYRYGISMLAALQQRRGIELTVGTTEETESTGPIPAAILKGSDYLDAAKDGYVFRPAKDRDGREDREQMTLVKKDRGLVLRIRPQELQSFEFRELVRIFDLTPNLPVYKIKSELAEEGAKALPATPQGGDTMYLSMRSLLQIGVFLSKGVNVPDEHVRQGIAPMSPGQDGRPFDWTQVTKGLFCVQVQPKKPRDAEVAVKYRGYWFFIPKSDVESRSMLAILEMLFALQETDIKQLGPLLTVSAGG